MKWILMSAVIKMRKTKRQSKAEGVSLEKERGLLCT